jgi:hypothetical protein
MVSSRKNEVANKSFVPVYDEVASKFFWLFVLSYELSRAETS